jgi:hypothetical protein
VTVTVLEEVDPPPPACPPGRQCTSPPPSLPTGRLRTWTSSGIGYSFQYPPALFEVVDESGSSVRLRLRGERPDGVDGEVWITGEQGRGSSAADQLHRREGELSASIIGLTEDDDPFTVLPPPRIGQVPGVGGSYRGTVDTPQGPAGPALATIIAASTGDVSVVVSYVLTGTAEVDAIRTLRTYLTPTLTSFRWPPGATLGG